jgi:hypothetical protein
VLAIDEAVVPAGQVIDLVDGGMVTPVITTAPVSHAGMMIAKLPSELP